MLFKGTIEMEIISADPGSFLTQLHQLGLEMKNVRIFDELSLCFQCSRKDGNLIAELAQKNGAECRILRKNGLYWSLCSLRKRPLLVMGLGLLLFLTLYLPTKVLFYRVEGNVQVEDRRILASAWENGLEFGTDRRAVRSEKVKNALLSAIPELEWVGINTSGCVATISVRERQEKGSTTEGKVSSIVAVRDGVIQNLTVTSGSPAVQIGQSVKAGDILISGYTDCGLTIRAERATGEVYAMTEYCFSVVLPEYSSQFASDDKVQKEISVIFGKNRINFSENSGILDTSCVKMYEEKYMTLPGGFSLPVAIVITRNIYSSTPDPTSIYEDILRQYAERYLISQMVAGSVISREETISQEDGIWMLEGRYVCLEMIGREQSEEIITS